MNFLRCLNENYESGVDHLVDINEETVQESQYEIGIEGALAHVYESQLNWNRIEEAINYTELTGFNATGDVDYVMESGKMKQMFDKIIEWFKSMWAKFVSGFKKFTSFIMSKIKSDKGFIKKFKEMKLTVQSDMPPLKIFKYTIDANHSSLEAELRKYCDSVMKRDIKSIMGSNELKDIAREVENVRSDMGNHIGTMRGIVCTGSSGSSISERDFVMRLKAKFRNGSTKPQEVKITQSDVAEYLKIVEDSNTTIKSAKDALAAIKKNINSCIDGVKSAKNNLSGDDKSGKAKSIATNYANTKIKLLRSQVQVLAKYNGQLISALTERNRTAKYVIYNVAGRQKKETTNESTMYGSFFDGAELI